MPQMSGGGLPGSGVVLVLMYSARLSHSNMQRKLLVVVLREHIFNRNVQEFVLGDQDKSKLP